MKQLFAPPSLKYGLKNGRKKPIKLILEILKIIAVTIQVSTLEYIKYMKVSKIL